MKTIKLAILAFILLLIVSCSLKQYDVEVHYLDGTVDTVKIELSSNSVYSNGNVCIDTYRQPYPLITGTDGQIIIKVKSARIIQ